MPLTKYGIEAMGFTKIPAGTKIKAVFNLVSVYSIEGIALNDIYPESFSAISHRNKDFSFAFGNSVNEISNALLGDDFAEDEAVWQKRNNANPPYLLIHFKIKDPYTCTSGHWKRTETQFLLTYDCFPNAKDDLKVIENRITPPLLCSLTVQLSKIHQPVRFKHVNREVYGDTTDGETLIDMRMDITARVSTRKGASPKEIKNIIADSLKQYKAFEPRVGSLFWGGLKEKDRFKKFLNFYQTLEIYTHKTFSQIDYEKHVDAFSPSPTRLAKSARQFFLDRQTESKNLTQRFMWCSILRWQSLQDADVEKFKQIKKCRDALSHGVEILEATLPVEDLENLLLKIL